MVVKAERRKRRYLERSKNIQTKLNKKNNKFEVMQENNVETKNNQVKNEEVSLDDNVETNSDSLELTESVPSKTIKCCSNLKDENAMNKQFAEQLAFYKNIKPSCESVKEVKTSEENS